MKKKNVFTLALAGMLAAGTLAASSSVFAAEAPANKSGETTVTVTKEAEQPNTPTYELSVPTALSVTSAGYTEAGAVTVSSTEDPFIGSVTVGVQQASGKFQNTADNKKTLAYTLKKKDEKTDLGDLIFRQTPAESETAVNSSIIFGVYIADADWNAAEDGTYEDVITFTAQYTRE